MSSFGERTYTAKRKHKHPCGLCAAAIRPGHKAVSWAWADYGTVDRVRVHHDCLIIARGRGLLDYEECWPCEFPLLEDALDHGLTDATWWVESRRRLGLPEEDRDAE